MSETVHILSTMLREDLADASVFVFKTLRRGFPNADIFVWANGMGINGKELVSSECIHTECNFRPITYRAHDDWIAWLIENEKQPFWICDTDIFFSQSVEGWFKEGEAVFAGRFEPEFMEAWTGTRHVKRLHTALMWFDPAAVRMAMRKWICRIPPPWRNHAVFPLIKQTFVPAPGETLFYDSCAGLYHAIGGTSFTREQNAAFEHLHCATYAHLVSPHIGVNLEQTHRAIYANPELAVGLQIGQDLYYESRKPV